VRDDVARIRTLCQPKHLTSNDTKIARGTRITDADLSTTTTTTTTSTSTTTKTNPAAIKSNPAAITVSNATTLCLGVEAYFDEGTVIAWRFTLSLAVLPPQRSEKDNY
jgi:hypothetical protein